MKYRNLKVSFKEHLENQSLSKKQLSNLMAIQDKQHDAVNPARHYALATAFAIVLVLSGLLLYNGQTPQGKLDERIGTEVALNHINSKPLEVKTSDMRAIQQYFTELDFMPVESRLLADSNLTLLGGRYCSIQGVTAAQLRLRDNMTGQVHSLYQTAYDEKTFAGLPRIEKDGKPAMVYSKGVGVEIWVEKGVLFAITRQPE